MDMGPHAFFILASYGVTAMVLAALILRAVFDHRVQLRALAELEGRGMRRRSAGGEPATSSGRQDAEAARAVRVESTP
jgi:heme exporter protein D